MRLKARLRTRPARLARSAVALAQVIGLRGHPEGARFVLDDFVLR